MKSVSVVVFGTVQGVYYRKSTQIEAQKRGLSGWVRNRRDGTVEIQAQGVEADILSFLEWCRKGPQLARVQKMDIHWLEAQEQFSSFTVKKTV